MAAKPPSFNRVDKIADQLYELLDADKNGRISVDEMLRGNVLLAESVHADIDFIEWSGEALKSIDLDNSGDVDKKEFITHIRSLEEILGISSLEKALKTQVEVLKSESKVMQKKRPLERPPLSLEAYRMFFCALSGTPVEIPKLPALSGFFLCGRTALHVLCDHFGSFSAHYQPSSEFITPLVKQCLAANVDPLQKDHLSMTALSCAIIRGKSVMLQAFKEAGCPPDVTAIRWAKVLIPAREFDKYAEHTDEVKAHIKKTGSVPNIVLWGIKGVAEVPKIPNNSTLEQVHQLLAKGASPHGVKSNDVDVCDALIRAGAHMDPKGKPDEIIELLRERYNYRYLKATKLTKVNWVALMSNAEDKTLALERLKKGYSPTNRMLIAFCRHFRYAGGTDVLDWFLEKKVDFTGAFDAVVAAHTEAQLLEVTPMSETTAVSKMQLIDWFLKRHEKTKVTPKDLGHLLFDTLCMLYKKRHLLKKDSLVFKLLSLRADVNYLPPPSNVHMFMRNGMFPESGIVRDEDGIHSGVTCAGILAACRPEEEGKSLQSDHAEWNVFLDAFKQMVEIKPKDVGGPSGLRLLLTLSAEMQYNMSHGNMVLFDYLVQTFPNQQVRNWARDNLLDYVFTGSWQIAQRIISTYETSLNLDQEKKQSHMAEMTKAITLVTQADLGQSNLERCMKYLQGNVSTDALEYQNPEGHCALAKAVLSTQAQTLVPAILKIHPNAAEYVNCVNTYTGDTPLILAARSVYPNNDTAMPAVVSALIDAKARIESRNYKSRSALLEACSWKKGKVCKLLLEATMEPWSTVEALLTGSRKGGDAYFKSILPQLTKMWEDGRLQLVHQLTPGNRLVPTRVVLVADRFMSPLLRLSTLPNTPSAAKHMLRHSLQEIATGLPKEAAAWCNLIHEKVAFGLMNTLCDKAKEIYARCEQLQKYEVKKDVKQKVVTAGSILVGRGCDEEPSQYRAFGCDEVIDAAEVDAAKLLALPLKYGVMKGVEELCSWVGEYSHPLPALVDIFKHILLKKADKWNAIFQEKMEKLYGKRHTMAPVKRQDRVDDKEVDDYPKEVKTFMETMTDTRSKEGRVKVSQQLLSSTEGRTACRKLLDLVRCSIICDSPAEVIKSINSLLDMTMEKDGVEALRVKSMFHPDLNVYVAPTFGYRDFKVNIAFDTGEKKSDGTPHLHIGEVQFILDDMLKVKKLMHGLYRIIRGDFQPRTGVYRINLDLEWPPGEKSGDSENMFYLPLDENRNKAIARIKEKSLELVSELEVVENAYKSELAYATKLVDESRKKALAGGGAQPEPDEKSEEEAPRTRGRKKKKKPRTLAEIDDTGFADWLDEHIPLIRQTAESTIRDTFFLYGAFFTDACDVNLQSLRAGRMEPVTKGDEDEEDVETLPTPERDDLLNEGLAEDLDEVKVQELFETLLREILVPFGEDITATQRLESRMVAESKAAELRFCRRGMRNKVAPQDVIPVKLYSKPIEELTFTAGDEDDSDFDVVWETELKPYVKKREISKDAPEGAIGEFSVTQEFIILGEKIGPGYVLHKFKIQDESDEDSEDTDNTQPKKKTHDNPSDDDEDPGYEYRVTNKKQQQQKQQVDPTNLRSYIKRDEITLMVKRQEVSEDAQSDSEVGKKERTRVKAKPETIERRRAGINPKFFEEIMPVESSREEMWARQQVRQSARKAVESRHQALTAAAAASDVNFTQLSMWGRPLADFTPHAEKKLEPPPQVLRHKEEWALIHSYIARGTTLDRVTLPKQSLAANSDDGISRMKGKKKKK